MNEHDKTAFAARERILKLLSDDENARVSRDEDGKSLLPGDEYIDLEALGEGVRRAVGSVMAMDRILARKSVQTGTWDEILAGLSANPGAAHLPPRA